MSFYQSENMARSEGFAVNQKNISFPDYSLAVEEACRAVLAEIGPLSSLQAFVAQNPLPMATQGSFLDLIQAKGWRSQNQFLPSLAHFRRLWHKGEILPEDLRFVLKAEPTLAGELSEKAMLDGILKAEPNLAKNPYVWPHECLHGPHQYEHFLVQNIGLWMSSLVDQYQAEWKPGLSIDDLQKSLLDLISRDRGWDVVGLQAARLKIKQARPTMSQLAKDLFWERKLEANTVYASLRSLCSAFFGWFAFLRNKELLGEYPSLQLSQSFLQALLTIEWSLLKQPELQWSAWPSPSQTDEEQALYQLKYLWLKTHEQAMRRRVNGSILMSQQGKKPLPSAQFVFCIDGRSEPIRQAIESRSPDYETIGFAGFFGLSLQTEKADASLESRCPVILKPSVKIKPSIRKKTEERLQSLHELFHSPATGMSFVESWGSLSLSGLLKELRPRFTRAKTNYAAFPVESVSRHSDLDLSEKVAFAQGFLKHSGLKGRCSSLVFLIGHGSHSRNNPQASALDCGACGGLKGDWNALVAASLLNDPDLRAALRGTEWSLPDSCVFVAAYHETSTQELRILDPELSASERMRPWLSFFREIQELSLSQRAQREGRKIGKEGALLESQLRAWQWSETRPEWGLARCAYFIAADRSWTANQSWAARSFLHNYNSDADPSAETLELILIAPLKVALGISLQYYFSTVEPDLLGSGNKTLHNQVGGIGVLEGSSYQLRPGLSLHSVMEGEHCFHEPLRLQVYIEAPRHTLEKLLSKHKDLNLAFKNEWMQLHRIDKVGNYLELYQGGQFQREA